MIEPKDRFKTCYSLNISNNYYIKSEIHKIPSSLFQIELNKKKYNHNSDYSNCITNSINSNNISLNSLSLSKINNKENVKSAKDNMKKLIYHKKSMNNAFNINKNNKSAKLNSFNIGEINIHNNNLNDISYILKQKENYNNYKFIDLSLNEFLKEEIKNMKYHQNRENINSYKEANNTEETKVNTLDINSYLLNDIHNTNSSRVYYAHNYFRNENKKFNKNLVSKNVKRISLLQKLYLDNSNNKSNRNILGYCDIYKLKINKKRIKKSLNKPNLIKKIEFISFKNNNYKNCSQYLSFNKQEYKTKSSNKKSKEKSLNISKKILNLSFKHTKYKKERKTYNFNTYKNHTKNIIFLNSKNKNPKLEMKNNHINESKSIKAYNDKNIKKIKIKKIDIIDKSNITNNENIFFNLNNDLERLIKENNLIKEKTNKKFRFCKSTK